MLRTFRAEQIQIVLHTARWERDRDKTVWWLEHHNIPYDQLLMDKPSGDLYVDDLNCPPFHPAAADHQSLVQVVRDRYGRRNGEG